MLCYMPSARIGTFPDLLFRETVDFIACRAELSIALFIPFALLVLYLVVLLIGFHDHWSLGDEQIDGVSSSLAGAVPE